MKIHDHIPSVAATLIMFIMFIFMLFIVKECRAWTSHELQVLSWSNNWETTSLAESIDRNIEKKRLKNRIFGFSDKIQQKSQKTENR